MDTVQFNSKLTFRELLQVNYYLRYSKPFFLSATLMGIIMFIMGMLHIAGVNMTFREFPTFQLIFGTAMILMPIFIYLHVKKMYWRKDRITEQMTCTFERTRIEIVGETFEVKMSWDKILKVVETKNWLLIYQTKFMANIISKNETDVSQMIELRALLKSIPGLKHKLRKN